MTSDAHSGRVRRPDPVRGVLDGGAAAGLDAEPAGCLEVDVRSRLAALDLLGRDDGGEEVCDPARSSTASISGRFEDEATASGNAAASRRTASTAPSISGRSLAIALEHPARRPRR